MATARSSAMLHLANAQTSVDPADLPTSVFTFANARDGVSHYLRRQSGVNHSAVRDGAGGTQCTWALGGHHDGHRVVAPADVAFAAQIPGVFTGQERAHGGDVTAKSAEPGRAQAEVQDGAVTGSYTQERPSLG